MLKSGKRIVVLAGGCSPEAQVSRSSGLCVRDALRKNFSNVELIDCHPIDLPRLLLSAQPDCVFSVLHGGVGEDGTVAGLLAMLGIPFVGSGLAASAMAMDKRLAKAMFRAEGLPVQPDIPCDQGEDLSKLSRFAVERFPEGGVVKAAAQGSAIGLTFCSNASEYAAAIAHALTFGPRALIERRFRGREVTVGLLEDPYLRALPPVEVRIPDGGNFDYYHRYTEGAAVHICPAEFSPEQRSKIEDIAIRAHRAIGCRHYSRVDLLVGADGDVALLELNTLPGMTKTSLYPDAARAASIPFEELVRRLVERALADGAPWNEMSSA